MNILLLGSGGREHALAWKLAQSPSCETLSPRRAIPASRMGGVVAIDPGDPARRDELARARRIGLVVIGPEAPLVDGLADALRDGGNCGLRPERAAAQLEGSKGFTKDLCAAKRHSDRRLRPGRTRRQP